MHASTHGASMHTQALMSRYVRAGACIPKHAPCTHMLTQGVAAQCCVQGVSLKDPGIECMQPYLPPP